MPDRYFITLKQMMASQAYRELVAAQMFGHGLQYVPALKYQKFMTWHIREEMEHYELVYKMYQKVTGESVEPIVNERLRQKPLEFASSWFELAMAQFLFDRGGYWQLKEYEDGSFLPYREVIQKIVKEEAGHQGLGEAMVAELCQTGDYEAVKQPLFNRWLRQGLLSFGRPGTEGGNYAISAGLKKRDAGEVMRSFIDDIKPCMVKSGLEFPSMKEIGIEAPPDLALSLQSRG